MKKIVPLTLGLGGEQIGEIEYDDRDPHGPMVMRLTNPQNAEMMAQLVKGDLLSGISINPFQDPKKIEERGPFPDCMGDREFQIKYSYDVERQLRDGGKRTVGEGESPTPGGHQ